MLFLTLFGAASAILFGYVYWQSSTFLTSQTDDWLGREVHAMHGARDPALIIRVNEHNVSDPVARRPFGLFAPSGRRLAGKLAALPQHFPLDRPFDYTLATAAGPLHLRAMIWRAPSGNLFAVAQDLADIESFEAHLVRALLSAGATMLVVGLFGAFLLGAASVRRMAAMTRAIERIVEGDLTGRLPAGGKSSDIDRLALVVNGMLDEIERLMQEVKGAGDNIAHDMRTPLTRLLAGLDRARRRDLSAEELAESVDHAIAEVNAILLTFAALIRISEIEDGVRRAGFRPVDIARVAEDVVDYYEPAADARNIRLTFEAFDAPTNMAGDSDLLFEALGNLVDNAIKFTPHGGQVTVRLNAGPVVSVSDTGPGIPAAEREIVLRRFHRAESSRTTPGNGLGLPLVAAIARLHRMELQIGDAGPGCVVRLAV